MTDTQTAFVLVPRELAELFVENDRRYTGEWWNDFHRFSAMLSAAPKPPESEIGPVANYLLGDAHRRIEADRAIIAALRVEVLKAADERKALLERCWRINTRAESAGARVKELEAVIGKIQIATDIPNHKHEDPAFLLASCNLAHSFASKKETVGE
jgi:hypothetical protein